jgi:hypothetical protein
MHFLELKIEKHPKCHISSSYRACQNNDALSTSGFRSHNGFLVLHDNPPQQQVYRQQQNPYSYQTHPQQPVYRQPLNPSFQNQNSAAPAAARSSPLQTNNAQSAAQWFYRGPNSSYSPFNKYNNNISRAVVFTTTTTTQTPSAVKALI